MADDEGVKRSDEELAELIVRLNQTYARAAYELKIKFDKYMDDFWRKDSQKQQDLAAGLITEDEYKRWRLGQILIGHRWQEMVDTMTADLVKVDQFAMAMVSDTSLNVFAVNHNYATFEVEQGSNLNTSYTLYNKDTVAYLVRHQPSLLPLPSVDIPKDQVWNRQHLASAILQGIMQGESMGKIADRVQAVADMDRKAALRNARTMVTCAQNAGRQAAYERGEKKGIHGVKMWVAAHDERVRASHAAIDGETAFVDEKFSNGLMFPGDKNGAPAEVYNCRCAMVHRVGRVDLKAYVKNKPAQNSNYSDWSDKRAPFKDLTNAYNRSLSQNKPTVSEKEYFIKDGVRYDVDGVNIQMSYSDREREVGELLSRIKNQPVELVPRVTGKYKNIETPDYILNGTDPWDLKDYKGAGKDGIRDAIKKHRGQGSNFIIDVSKSALTDEQINDQVSRVFRTPNTSFIEEVIIVRDGVVVLAYKRN